jgi:Uma2 family endonuclease
MSIARQEPRMTREQFLNWTEAQDERYEFDGFQPVAMTGWTRDHSHIAGNIRFALH